MWDVCRDPRIKVVLCCVCLILFVPWEPKDVDRTRKDKVAHAARPKGNKEKGEEVEAWELDEMT